MASQEFTVLYTHQKTKKSKVWQDGILKATLGGNKATLFDDKGQILDSMFVKFQVKPGDDLESEQYLITIEAQKASETDCSDQPKNAEVPTLIRNNLKSFASSSLHIPVGLKRKHTGFQGPCQVEKKMTTMEASAAVISPSSMAPHSYFPSQFYVNSPLFSVPYKKNEEIDLHFNFSRNTFIANDRNAHSVTSLAFTPYVNDNKVVQSRNHSTDGADAEYLETGIELDNGTVNSNYHASTNVAVLQNVRSKAQILSLLNGEGKHFKVPEDETTASLENVPLTIMKSEFHQKCQLLSEPSRSRESFFKEKIVPLSGSTNNTTKETIKYTVPPHFSEKNVQTKSRWDAYLPSSLTEKSNKDDGEYSNKNVSDLLKDNGTDNRSQYREDHKKMPASLEISISSVKIQPCSIVPPESIRRKENDTEALPSVGSMNYSNCINALKMFEDKHPTFNKYTLIDNLNGFCQQSQNESYPITCSEMNSANSAEGEFGDKQLTEVNFSLLDKLEFSDTEDGKLHMNSTLSQGSVCSKEDTEAQLEISVQKNCDMKACSSEGKGNVQPAFLQDRGVNYVSECQRVQFHEEISEKPNKIEENHVTLPFLKKLQHSKATIINEKIEANAISIQNIGDQRDLGTDLLTVNNMDCEVNNSEHHNPTTHLGKGNVPAVLSSCFMDKSNERGIEVGADSLQPSSIDICDNMKQSNYLLAFTEKYNISHGFPQYILDKHDAASEKNYLDFRPITHPFNCGTSSDESQMSKNEFENAVDSLNFLYKSNEDNKKDSICVKASVDSSSLPQLVNGFSLLKSLTEHSTALESLQMIEENTLSLQKEKQRKKHEATGPEVKQKLAEVLLSEDVQISPCLYSGSPKMDASLTNDVEKPTTAIVNVLHDQSPFEVVDSQPKLVEFQGYRVRGSAASEIMMRGSCSHLRWDPQANMAEFEIAAKDDCFFSAQEPGSPVLPGFIKTSQPSDCYFPPSPSSKKSVGDMQEQEFMVSRIVPHLPVDSAKSFSRMEESSCPEDMSILLPPLRIRTPVVTVPVDGEPSDLDVYSSVKMCEEGQQSFVFSVVDMYDKPQMLGPEDRMCETFVGEKCIGERHGVLTQSALLNVSEQKRQSKWQKYQNTVHSDLTTQNNSELVMTDDIRAESGLGMPLDDTGESRSGVINESAADFVHLQMMKSMLCKQQRNFSSQDSVSEGKKLSLHLNQKFSTEEGPKVLGQLNCHNITRHAKNSSELFFPSAEMVNSANVPKRQMYIPAVFQSPAHYKQVFTTALIEHLNILLFELSQKLHKALGKVDISFYMSVKGGQGQENSAPLCNHKTAAKLVMVKKEGRNKGRLFYACDAPKADRCDFFKWLEDINPGHIESRPSIVLHDMKSIGTYLRCQNIYLYEECQFVVRKAFDIQSKRFGKLKKFNSAYANFDYDSKSKIYIKLNRKEHSSVYSKDDLWVVSKTLTFEPLDTFIACSVFFGPSSNNELELVPLKGYSPSNWHSNMIARALLVCNVSTELTTLRNIEENINSATLPIMEHLLKEPFKAVSSSNRINKRKFNPPALNTNTITSGALSAEMSINLANKMIQTFNLNKDQAMALIQIGSMMTSQGIDTEMGKQQALPITVIHGVFGSGKSYLLAIVILFLVQIFETSEATDGKSLLDLGFEEFIRVGSIRKIAKPVLPYSLHAGSGPEHEQLKELLGLMKDDLTPAEKVYVRKTIEHYKLGTNKGLLQQVRVVGATCAACPFSCMKNLKFPIVVLDECSQMTEPASLLPVARFECEKLILVGDPKQLPPTIQGSESAHSNSLEQTLFDRLCLMGHEPILLRTQYRCHPAISAIANDLFYEGNLLDGISEVDRSPLMDWLPTLCFYNVNGLEQVEKDNSFHNMAESFFTVKLIQSLIASGIEGAMIGVITLYKSQMSKICNLLNAVHSDASQIKAVQVSTVDAFQGAEKEIIVLSCVRTRQVGFIDSEKRVNVALTRGKRHLLIVGNLNCLRKNKLWGHVIQHCAGRKNGLQHVSQCEQRLNDIIKSYLERKKEEEINMEKKKSTS
ncbi:protein ZGRF1 isoform X3 [Rhineura floridana]|uniref:protein ZGRF1 isoform X3 n=1 Tax=Rhineura floridana TaxID=261503 RepID=UPI002AC865AE|nr:protein ZGRF1 isoform X3 [Rhineura floridana]